MNSTQKVEKPTSVWDRLGQAVTVATVIGFISQVFGSSTRGTALICVVALVVTWIGLYVVEKSPQTREKIYTSRIAPSKIVALVLAAVLGGALLRQYSIDSKIPFDPREISYSLQRKIKFCSIKFWSNREDCILNALMSLTTEIQATHKNLPEELFADQVLGEVVRASDEAMDLFNHHFGVYEESFLGTGESLPAQSSNFTDGRIPEYLVPNYPDRHPGVLVWTLTEDDPLLKRTLQALLDSNSSG